MKQIRELQRLLGIDQDGDFGPKTTRAYAKRLGKSDIQVAIFLGQCYVESGGFKVFKENLNYSETQLRRYFSKYFDSIRAKYYARQPIEIANYMYANRMGNGPYESGDGWKHRGFGAIQLTGKKNQYDFADYIGDQRIKDNPDLIADNYAFEAAVWFFDVNKIWEISTSMKDCLRVSKAVNLGNPESKLTPFHAEIREEKAKMFLEYLK